MTREKLDMAVKKAGIPILWEFTPIVYPSLYVDEYKHGGGLYGNGTETEGKTYVKIHVWSKNQEECTLLGKTLRRELEAVHINAVIDQMNDASIGVFRSVFALELIEEDEE